MFSNWEKCREGESNTKMRGREEKRRERKGRREEERVKEGGTQREGRRERKGGVGMESGEKAQTQLISQDTSAPQLRTCIV